LKLVATTVFAGHAQLLAMHSWPGVHALVQLPQAFTLFDVSTHSPPQFILGELQTSGGATIGASMAASTAASTTVTASSPPPHAAVVMASSRNANEVRTKLVMVPPGPARSAAAI
jgi:hypothetical protein